ncbi:hypothetical protein KI688_008555 [Linnemannia hyalina]|uniref:Extracellular membrane protein CFEM domain-containing protein n=1 Tax=Linnemannia hyalina TaxID=64524 RepID=A0A9P7Y1H2_9FUNG|nr:hypothetical protein KI688_008555 [Linnemannia hyalina]
MKVPVVLTAIVVAPATASAYVCPSPTDVAHACKQLNVFPLVCYNPDLNKDACNAKQCYQQYIDDYAVCQCRRTTSNFYEHSRNVEGLIRRCGGGLSNLYGPSSQYERNGGSGTQHYHGTTYYGGSTQVANGTTRTSSVGPAVRTRNTNVAGSTTAQPFVAPTPVPTDIPISAQSESMSGGAIAGTVLGILGAFGLAGLLGWCWRRSRATHVPVVSTTTRASHGATRTVVSEKTEPLVVKSANAGQTYHAASAPVAATAAGADAAAGAAGGAAYASRSQPARSNTSYPTTTSGVPAASTSHVQPGTAITCTTTGTSNIPAPSGQTTASIGQPGSTTTYNTTSSSGGNTHVHPGVSSTTYSTGGQQAAGATNASTTYTSGSSTGHTTIQPSSTTNTIYNTTTTPGRNATTTGSGNAGQTGNNSTIYSSNNGYNPKSHK